MNLEMALDILKKSGIRMTPQRYAVLSYLYEHQTHPTADEIYKALEKKFPNMSVATVYNNLRAFKELGLVQELTYGDHSSRFDADISEHYHLICTQCGSISDLFNIEIPNIEQAISEQTGYKIDYKRVEIYGVCPKCQTIH